MSKTVERSRSNVGVIFEFWWWHWRWPAFRIDEHHDRARQYRQRDVFLSAGPFSLQICLQRHATSLKVVS